MGRNITIEIISIVFFALMVNSFDVPGMPSMPDVPGVPDLPISDMASSSLMSSAGRASELREAVKTCRSEVGLSREEAISIITQNSPSTQKGECFSMCIKKEIGIITEDYTYDIDKIRDLLGPMEARNPEMFNKIISAAEECSNAGAHVKDNCQKGKKMRECIKAKGVTGSIGI